MFETVQKKLNKIGFGANHSPLNKYHIRGVLISMSAIASQFKYVFHEVNSVQEYMLSFFIIIVGIAIFISFLTTIFKITDLYELIYDIQAITTKSE